MIFRTPQDGWGPITPRQWQIEALDIFIRHFSVEKPTPALMRAIMGAGKSKLIAQALACGCLRNDEVVVISTSSIQLVEQLRDTLNERLCPDGFSLEEQKVGAFYTHGKSTHTPIIVACTPSLGEVASIVRQNNKKCALYIADECVRAGTLIATPSGEKPIESLRCGDTVWGWDHNANQATPTRVINTFERDTLAPIFNVAGIKITPEHPVYTENRDYTAAGVLSDNDKIRVVPQEDRCANDRIRTEIKLLRDYATNSYPPIEGAGVSHVYNIETGTANYFANGVLVHNCHKTEVTTVHDAVHLLEPERTWGVTATPFRSDADERLSLFHKMIFDYGPARAMEDKVVVPWRIIPWDGASTDLDVACIEMTKRATGPGIFNATSIADAELFATRLKDAGWMAETVHSKLKRPEIKKRLDALRDGHLNAVVAVSMLSEGVDFPWLRWMVLRRPVTARTRFVQEVGRALRSYTDKNGVPIKYADGSTKTEAIFYDPHSLFDEMRLSYEAVLGGEYEVDATDDKMSESEKKERELTQLVFDMMRSLVEAKAGKSPVCTPPLAAYLRELVTAFDVCGLIERKITSKTWRDQGVSLKQKNAIDALRWTTTLKQVPAIHQKALYLLAEQSGAINRGMGSDMLSVMMSLAQHKKWPNLKVLDQSAQENIEKHQKPKLPKISMAPSPYSTATEVDKKKGRKAKAPNIGPSLMDLIEAQE